MVGIYVSLYATRKYHGGYTSLPMYYPGYHGGYTSLPGIYHTYHPGYTRPYYCLSDLPVLYRPAVLLRSDEALGSEKRKPVGV